MKTVFASTGGTRQGMKASLTLYLHENFEEFAWKKRPVVIVVPGGAYEWVSDREADPVAMQFLAMGYHAAVLRYTCAPVRYPDTLLQLATSHLYVRRHAEEFGIDSNAVFSVGFSAGGHLVCSYCENWKRDFVKKALEKDISYGFVKQKESVDYDEIKPNGMILGYPVITSGDYAHRGSIDNLLGPESEYESPERYRELLDEVSLEKHVNGDVPPAFIWGTAEDVSVPPMNSVMLVSALLEKNIPVEYHLFRQGGHGLALSDQRTASASGSNQIYTQNSCWIEMAHAWIEGLRNGN